MTIKEQIEIARLIASGTPREVAISEKVIPTSSMYRDELTPQQKAKARLAAEKERQDELKGKGIGRTAKPATLKKIKVKGASSTTPMQKIDKDQDGADATLQFGKNIVKKLTGMRGKGSASSDDDIADKIAKKISKNKEKEPEKLQATEEFIQEVEDKKDSKACLLYTSPSPRDRQKSRMPSSA